MPNLVPQGFGKAGHMFLFMEWYITTSDSFWTSVRIRRVSAVLFYRDA